MPKMQEMITVRLSDETYSYLIRTAKEGGYRSVAHLVRSLVEEIQRDDEAAHETRQ